VEPLVNVLRIFSDENTKIVLSQEVRDYSDRQVKFWDDFKETLSKHFSVSKVPKEKQHPYFYADDILLLNLRLKAKDS
jgi:hypothetical protein